MIKLLTEYFPTTLLEISDAETTESLQQKLQARLKENFVFDILETQTGRLLPRDEILIDEREYFAVVQRFPNE